LKINVGSGPYPLEGFINVDLYYPAQRADNAVALATFEANSADEIMASHILEHLGVHEAPIALARWHEVLQPGGLITVKVPNIVLTIRRWLEYYEANDPRLWGFRSQGLWGTQVHPGEHHRWGYDERLLRQLLAQTGFEDITIQFDLVWDQDSNEMLPLGLMATARKAK